MADLSFLLSPQDRAKLGRQIGISLPDGRRFQRGVLTSAQDAAQADATSAMNAGYAAQTGQYANRSPSIDPRQMGQNAYSAQMSQNFQAMQPAQGGPAAVGGAQVGAMPQPSPYEDMLNRARLAQQSFQAGSGAMQPSVSAPIASPAPYNSNATAQIGGRTFGGPSGEAFPAAQGFGFPEAPATQAQQGAFSAQTQAAPAPDLLRPRTTQEIAAMSPAQRAGLVQFGQEQAAARAPKPIKLQSFRSADAQGNPIEVTVDEFGRPIGQGPVRPTSTTNIIGAKEEGEAEKVVGKAEGEFFTGLADSAEKASETTANLEKIRSLYSSGAYSGPGATVATKLKQIGATLGLIDANSAATQDELQAELAKGVLTSTKEFFKGMGALSNLEGAKAESAVANLSRTPEGNLRILEWQNANAPTIIEGNRLKEEARAEGKSISEANAIARKFMRANYKKLSDVKVETPSPAPASAPMPNRAPVQPVQRIRNAQTGEIRELRDGQWVSVK